MFDYDDLGVGFEQIVEQVFDDDYRSLMVAHLLIRVTSYPLPDMIDAENVVVSVAYVHQWQWKFHLSEMIHQ